MSSRTEEPVYEPAEAAKIAEQVITDPPDGGIIRAFDLRLNLPPGTSTRPLSGVLQRHNFSLHVGQRKYEWVGEHKYLYTPCWFLNETVS